MENFIIVFIVVLIVGLATAYIIREKKNGRKCIGCPKSGSCPKCCCNKPQK